MQTSPPAGPPRGPSATPPSAPGGLDSTPLTIDIPPSRRELSHHDIIFTGSGSEYFRIWIVNLVLMLLTLGLYYPWAKVRKLRYFYGNTIVAGYPLAYHADARQSFRGFLLVAVLMAVYSLAGQTSPLASGVAGLILAAIWPALFRASLQFRMANTSWRGLRMGFHGSLKDAYLVFLTPMALVIGTGALMAVVMPFLGQALGHLASLLIGLAMLLMLALIGPYTWWRLKRYQHSHYTLGQLQTQFKASFGDVSRVFLQTSLLGLAALALLGGMLAAMLWRSGLSLRSPGTPEVWAALLGQASVLLIGFGLLTQLLVGAFYTSRMHNLVWGRTGNRQMRFKGHLHVGAVARVSATNIVLLGLTLGLYWPFALVAMTRLKLHAIEVISRLSPEQLMARARPAQTDAAGDFAADLIGVDVGL